MSTLFIIHIDSILKNINCKDAKSASAALWNSAITAFREILKNGDRLVFSTEEFDDQKVKTFLVAAGFVSDDLEKIKVVYDSSLPKQEVLRQASFSRNSPEKHIIYLTADERGFDKIKQLVSQQHSDLSLALIPAISKLKSSFFTNICRGYNHQSSNKNSQDTEKFNFAAFRQPLLSCGQTPVVYVGKDFALSSQAAITSSLSVSSTSEIKLNGKQPEPEDQTGFAAVLTLASAPVEQKTNGNHQADKASELSIQELNAEITRVNKEIVKANVSLRKHKKTGQEKSPQIGEIKICGKDPKVQAVNEQIQKINEKISKLFSDKEYFATLPHVSLENSQPDMREAKQSGQQVSQQSATAEDSFLRFVFSS